MKTKSIIKMVVAPVLEMIAYFNFLESGLCLRINRLSRRASIRHFFSIVSKLGDGYFWGIIAAVIFAMQGPDAIRPLLHVGITALVGVAAYKLLKHRLVRERPYINHGDIVLGTPPLDRYSFPSGHTLHAFSFTTLYLHIEPSLWPILVPFAALVAASRVVLGLHYPTDVIAGGALGFSIAYVSKLWL